MGSMSAADARRGVEQEVSANRSAFGIVEKRRDDHRRRRSCNDDAPADVRDIRRNYPRSSLGSSAVPRLRLRLRGAVGWRLRRCRRSAASVRQAGWPAGRQVRGSSGRKSASVSGRRAGDRGEDAMIVARRLSPRRRGFERGGEGEGGWIARRGFGVHRAREHRVQRIHPGVGRTRRERANLFARARRGGGR